MHRDTVIIKHCRNVPSTTLSCTYVTVCDVKVSGYDQQNNTAYQFHDCFKHGCRQCFRSREKPYIQQMLRMSLLRERGVRVVEIWLCEYRYMQSKNRTFRAFQEEVPVSWNEPLNVRHSFFGGRTNATTLHHKMSPGQKGRYLDVVSLYPTVMKYGEYPVGHPVIIIDPSLDALIRGEYFGVVKCVVLPPTDLYHPVLPVRMNGKLLFPLCRQCAMSMASRCIHVGDREARSFLGTWCTPELMVAMEKGYEILSVREVHHFPEKRQGLFSEYVNTFLKGKQEASGWPQNDMTDESKEQYISDYKDHENIVLDPDKIMYNKGLRETNKLCLNSFWGRFALRSLLMKSKICMSAPEFYATVMSERMEVERVHVNPNNPDVLEVLYTENDSESSESDNTNIYLAAFTTCLARLRLYKLLDVLGRRVLYFDTDSVIFVEEESAAPPLTCGSYLGDLTDELSSDGSSYITEFVSTGPKSYSYTDSLGYQRCKFKGISKSLHNLRVINLKSMLTCIDEGIVLDEASNLVFKLDKFGRIKTDYVSKLFRMVYTKRVITHDYETLPFGYVDRFAMSEEDENVFNESMLICS